MKIKITLITMLFALTGLCGVPRANTGTDPNVWTENYSGVLEAAKKTGYPILVIVIDSQTCGHCTLFMNTTVDSDGFRKIGKDYRYYQVLLDNPYVQNRATWNSVVNRYYSYFDSGMYPLCAILKSDGSLYRAFGNSTTDKGNISATLYDLIGQLAGEPTAGDDDKGIGGGDEPAKPVTPPVVAPTAAELGKILKGNFVGLLTQSGEVVGSFTMSVKSKGSVTIRFVDNGVKRTVKATLYGDKDGNVFCKSDDGKVSFSYDSSVGVWVGSYGSRLIFARAKVKKLDIASAFFTGSANSAKEHGYLTCSVAPTGKMKVAGKLAGELKISANAQGVLVPSPWAAELFGKLVSGGGDAIVGAIYKSGKINGGVAVSGSDFASSFSARNGDWTAIGGRWNQAQDLKVLDGKELVVDSKVQGVKIKAVSNKKVEVADDSLGWKIKANTKKGVFSGTAKTEAGKLKFEGALMNLSGVFGGVGVIGKGAGSKTILIQ